MQFVVAEPFDTIEREDEQFSSSDNNLAKVFRPEDGVQSIRRFLSCNKCQSNLVPVSDKKIVKCSECKQRCSTKSLMLFDRKLRELYKLYLEQNTSAQAEFRLRYHNGDDLDS